jgi:hypothetical protein
MAISNNAIIEIDKSVGDDTNNAGYFNPASGGGAGTDYSLASSGPMNFSDLVIDATTNTKVKSAGTASSAAWFRNGLRITGGPGFTTGLYEIINTAIDGNGFISVDRAIGTTGSTGGTGRIGGPLASLGGLGALMATTSGHTAFVKYNATTYDHSATQNVPGGRYNSNGIAIVGYNTNRTLWNTDALQPTLNAAVATMTMITTSSVGNTRLHNLILDNTGGNLAVTLANLSANFATIWRCTFKRSNVSALSLFGSARIWDCLFDTNSGNQAILSTSAVALVARRVIVKNCSAQIGINLSGSTITYNLSNVAVINFTGGTTALQMGLGIYILDHVSLQNASTSNNSTPARMTNSGSFIEAAYCIFDGGHNGGGSTGYGFYNASGGSMFHTEFVNCAFRGDAGNHNFTPADYEVGSVTLTASALNSDGTLNSTSGGGAACKSLGYTYFGSTASDYADDGAFQVAGGPETLYYAT